MAPCVVFVDEIEKALAGVQSGGQTDSGVGARLFGALAVAGSTTTSPTRSSSAPATTSRRLPPEFSRAERFDAIFFLDLPGPAEKERDLADVPGAVRPRPGQRGPATATGPAPRSRACCRLAALLDVPLVEAAQNIVPVAVTAGESVERLRNWAAGRCLAADRPGPLHPGRRRRRSSPAATSAATRRPTDRDRSSRSRPPRTDSSRGGGPGGPSPRRPFRRTR